MRWSVVLLALVLVGCAERTPSRPPDISGQITRATTSVVDGSRRITVLVETRPSDVSGSPKALEDLLPGTTVSVWFEGPVAESYPLQARAGTLLIMANVGP